MDRPQRVVLCFLGCGLLLTLLFVGLVAATGPRLAADPLPAGRVSLEGSSGTTSGERPAPVEERREAPKVDQADPADSSDWDPKTDIWDYGQIAQDWGKIPERSKLVCMEYLMERLGDRNIMPTAWKNTSDEKCCPRKDILQVIVRRGPRRDRTYTVWNFTVQNGHVTQCKEGERIAH